MTIPSIGIVAIAEDGRPLAVVQLRQGGFAERETQVVVGELPEHLAHRDRLIRKTGVRVRHIQGEQPLAATTQGADQDGRLDHPCKPPHAKAGFIGGRFPAVCACRGTLQFPLASRLGTIRAAVCSSAGTWQCNGRVRAGGVRLSRGRVTCAGPSEETSS